MNLLLTAYMQAHWWRIPRHQPGLVFLSGPNDTYVDSEATANLLKSNAPSFSIVTYEKALHEIDNEVPLIANDLRQRTVKFLDSITSRATND